MPIGSYGGIMGGGKILLSLTDSGNDWYLNIQIYKGGSNKPRVGPEGIQWRIINGKDSGYDGINVIFTDIFSGKTSKEISLLYGERYSYKYSTRGRFYR